MSDRTNVDKANMRGIEATFNWTISPEWNLAANYTFTDTEQNKKRLHMWSLNDTN